MTVDDSTDPTSEETGARLLLDRKPAARVATLPDGEGHDRARRSIIPILLIAGLVVVSAAIRIAVSTSFEAPWIAPDEMIYALSGSSFWATGHSTLFGAAAPFYSLYPLLVGLPIHLFGPAQGVTAAQCAQALVMSLTAALAWGWARPLAGDAWALAAAVLTACLPALAYSGLLMSEAVFLPAGTLALWLAARAIERPTRVRQAWLILCVLLAVGARLQGVVLVPILFTAACLAAWFARDAGVIRRLLPTWIAIAAGIVAWAGLQLAAHGGLGESLGAYSIVLTHGYGTSEVARWAFRHAGDLFLLVVGVPLVAAAVLAYTRIQGARAGSGGAGARRRDALHLALAHARGRRLRVALRRAAGRA